MAKVFKGEKYNPYGIGCTLYWQWEAECLDAQLLWYREELMPKFGRGSMPRVGEALTGRRYAEADDRPLLRAQRRVAELEDWIDNHHPVVHVAETNCDGVMCLVDEDDLKEILDVS